MTIRPSPSARQSARPSTRQRVQKIGYVIKRYPRFSETFIVNEILAHEAAGRGVEIFSLFRPTDTHFQDMLGRVRAPVTYLLGDGVTVPDFWEALKGVGSNPGFARLLRESEGATAREVYLAARLAVMARFRGVAHLHAHFAAVAADVARLAAAVAGISFTVTAHAKDIFHETIRWADLRRRVRGALAVITVSDFNAAYLRRNLGAGGPPVTRLYNGIVLDRFPFRAEPRRSRLILAIGRLVEKKGFAVLVDACALLARDGIAFACEIVGEGDQAPALRAQIRRLRLGQRVKLVGERAQAEVVARLGEASILAAPCVTARDGDIDGLPTVLLEAMATGTPCVATDVTGIPEAVQHGKTGLIVPQNNPGALSAALGRLLADQTRAAEFAQAGRRLVEERFNAHRAADEQIRIFGLTGRPVRSARKET